LAGLIVVSVRGRYDPKFLLSFDVRSYPKDRYFHRVNPQLIGIFAERICAPNAIMVADPAYPALEIFE
jgi:hypothetical protein